MKHTRFQQRSGLTIDTDYVLDATGRNPNVEGIGLDQVGIEYSKKGISVDGHLRTNVSNIYASGDVLDKAIPKLTPTRHLNQIIFTYFRNDAR